MDSGRKITLEDILNLRFDGANCNEIRVLVKKTVPISQYNTEVFEAETSITINENFNGIERALVEEVLHISLEFSIYSQLLARKLISLEDFMIRKQDMLNSCRALIGKLNSINPDSKILKDLLAEFKTTK